MSVILSSYLIAEITIRFIETCFDEAEPPNKCIMYVEDGNAYDTTQSLTFKNYSSIRICITSVEYE